MEQTYLCKFDTNGRRTETLLSCEFTEEEKAEKIADGYIEISEEDWNYYVGNHGNGDNGTGYIRGADGKPTSAPPYVPSKAEKLAALDAQYDSDKAELSAQYVDAMLANNTDVQNAIREALNELDAQYDADRKSIKEG